MKNLYRFIAALILVALLAGCAPTTPAATAVPPSTPVLTPPTFDTFIPIAKAYVSELSSGNFLAAYNRFGAALKSSVPMVKLQDTWQQLLSKTGAFQQQTSTRTLTVQGKPAVAVACDFVNGTLEIIVTFNNNSEITGMSTTNMATSIQAPSTF